MNLHKQEREAQSKAYTVAFLGVRKFLNSRYRLNSKRISTKAIVIEEFKNIIPLFNDENAYKLVQCSEVQHEKISQQKQLIIFYEYLVDKGLALGMSRKPHPIKPQAKTKKIKQSWVDGKISKLEGTEKWRALRYQALKKYGGKCCLCGMSAKEGIILHVDHIKPKSFYPELQYDINNLQVLCEPCNLGKCNFDDTDWR